MKIFRSIAVFAVLFLAVACGTPGTGEPPPSMNAMPQANQEACVRWDKATSNGTWFINTTDACKIAGKTEAGPATAWISTANATTETYFFLEGVGEYKGAGAIQMDVWFLDGKGQNGTNSLVFQKLAIQDQPRSDGTGRYFLSTDFVNVPIKTSVMVSLYLQGGPAGDSIQASTDGISVKVKDKNAATEYARISGKQIIFH